MGMFNRFEVGLVQRAGQIAVKRGLTYNQDQKCFKGDDRMAVVKAEIELLEWRERQKRKDR